MARIKKEGKIYDAVVALLRRRGVKVEDLGVVRFGGGSYYEVTPGNNIIGGYNHVSKRLTLAADIVIDN